MTAPHLDAGQAKKTLDLLWERVRQRGDLPGFSKVVNSIVGAMRGDNDREFNMTKTVLSDPALTQRVLRLANSAMYSVFGLGINTVTKAVIVLGTESIGHLALGLKLIDGLSTSLSTSLPTSLADAPSTRIELEKAILAGHIGRQVASSANRRDVEEAVVCSMLHTLGRMMVSFYLPESWALIQQRGAGNPILEGDVAQEVLGISLVEMGRMIAQQWGLPSSLMNSMTDVAPRSAGEPMDHMEWLATVSTVSSRCANAICQSGGSNVAELSQIIGDYADMLDMDAAQIMAAVDAALHSVKAEEAISTPIKLGDSANKDEESPPLVGKPVDAAQLLTRGVTELRGAIPNASVTQLMTMALETVFKGLGFSRSIIFLRNTEHNH
ncbi:MAG: HDOD domain-containing protein, partial [Burkholderiales bacterium]